jgi:hypothetical protein
VILSLVIVPGRPTKGTPEDVLRHFGSDDGQALGLRLLRQAVERRDATDVDYALVVCSVFGLTTDHLDLLIHLGSADWHHRHEEVVRCLDGLRAPAAVDVLDQALRRLLDSEDEILRDRAQAQLALRTEQAQGG